MSKDKDQSTSLDDQGSTAGDILHETSCHHRQDSSQRCEMPQIVKFDPSLLSSASRHRHEGVIIGTRASPTEVLHTGSTHSKRVKLPIYLWISWLTSFWPVGAIRSSLDGCHEFPISMPTSISASAYLDALSANVV